MNGTYGMTTAAPQTGPKLIDDLLRRELRVSDPRNALEVVAALRRRYSADAARLDQEAAGMPIRFDASPAVAPPVSTAETPGSREERRVQLDLESDLAGLIESRDNREWAPEIRGWRDALLREFVEGAAAARFAQDPAMRDRGFLAVRKLGEYARVARLVGVMNLPLNLDYRRLAASLDTAANVIRILMGEALYGAGLADGGFIIQVPITDLRVRRDSLVLAVRRLTGTVELSDDGADWGDAVAAYRDLLDELRKHSAPELGVYLREEFLTRVLDGLVSSVSRQDPESLRHVAATVPVEIARLNRLVSITTRLGMTDRGTTTAAGLSFFIHSLQLFVDAFRTTRSGARLIDLAVPLPMATHQIDEPDRQSRRILREIVSRRGDYAAEIECLLACCGSDVDELTRQVQLDKVLFDIDRAIDLYAQGVSSEPDWGYDKNEPYTYSEEQRAAAYSVIIRAMVRELEALPASKERPELVRIMNAVVRELEVALPDDPEPLLREVFAEQRQSEGDWKLLVASLAPRCLDGGRGDLTGAFSVLLGNEEPEDTEEFVVPPPTRVSLHAISRALQRRKSDDDDDDDDDEDYEDDENGGASGGDDGTTSGATAASDEVFDDARRYAERNGASDELADVVRDWLKRRRYSDSEDTNERARESVFTAPSARSGGASALDPASAPPDPVLVTFVQTLSEASGARGELQRALDRRGVRVQYRSLKERQLLPPDLAQALRDVLDPEKKQVDMNHVRELFQRILSREESGDQLA